MLDWTTHTGGGQDLAAGLDYVALPPGLQNQNRTELLTVTGPERAGAAHQVSGDHGAADATGPTRG